MPATHHHEAAVPHPVVVDDQTARGGDLPVELFIRDTVTLIEPTSSLRDAAIRLQSDEVGMIAVGAIEAVIGVISERDIVRCVANGLDLDATPVEAVETEDLKWAARGSAVDDVVEKMLENYLRHILIADDAGILVGVVSMRDLMSAYLP